MGDAAEALAGSGDMGVRPGAAAVLPVLGAVVSPLNSPFISGGWGLPAGPAKTVLPVQVAQIPSRVRELDPTCRG